MSIRPRAHHLSGVTQTFDAANELTNAGYSYDARGNRTAGFTPSGQPQTYGYDQANRLTQVTASATPGQQSVGAGDNHSVALKSDGTVWDWGHNDNGQLGNNSTTSSSVPVQASGVTNVVGVSAGGAETMAVEANGTVWDWGYNAYGQLGNNSTTNSSIPIQVTRLTGTAVAVAAGDAHALALKSDGTVWAWGDNASGQLGNNSTTNSSVPVQARGLTGVVAIASGNDHSLAIKSDGTLWAWGDNEAGGLGNNSTTNSLVPIQVTRLTGTVVAVAGGSTHTIALKSDGTVWTWGNNSEGQLGNNSTTNSLVPIQVTALSGVAAVAAGGHNSMAVTSAGAVWDWGNNSAGQLGNNSTTNSHVPVEAVGITAGPSIAINGSNDAHTLAVKSDGTLWAWGSNTYGQLGNNSTTNSHVPIQSNMSSVTLAATQATYAYNGDGLRMSKTVSRTATQQTWDVAEGLPLLLVDGSTSYVYGPDGLPLEQVSPSGTLYYYQDQLGSTRALANSSGSVVATYTYGPYGSRTGSTGTVPNPFGYAGQYTDAESGLVYLRARYYDPGTGQFLSRDPLVAITQNVYSYTGDNPLNGVDPTGLLAPQPPGPPPVPVPGAGPDVGWKWNPNPGSPRTGSFGPESPLRTPNGSQPKASWDPEGQGHWDVTDPCGQTQRYDWRGNPITEQQAHNSDQMRLPKSMKAVAPPDSQGLQLPHIPSPRSIGLALGIGGLGGLIVGGTIEGIGLLALA